MSIDNDIDDENFTSPFQPYLYTDIFHISPSIYRIIKKEIKMIQFYSSDDLIKNNEKYYEGYKYEDTIESFDFRKEGLFPGAFSQINIQASNSVSIYKRKYQKLYEILPKIGGVTQTITFICLVIVNFFTSNYNKSKIIIHTFDNNEIKNYFPKLEINEALFKRVNEREKHNFKNPKDFQEKNYIYNNNNNNKCKEEKGNKNKFIINDSNNNDSNNNNIIYIQKNEPSLKVFNSKLEEINEKKEKENSNIKETNVKKKDKMIINESHEIINLKENNNNYSFKNKDKSLREKISIKSKKSNYNSNNNNSISNIRKNNEENSIDNLVKEFKEFIKDKENENFNDNNNNIIDSFNINNNINNKNIDNEFKDNIKEDNNNLNIEKKG
jgi:hypothetical protein